MNLAERFLAPTPKFHARKRNVCVFLAAVATAVANTSQNPLVTEIAKIAAATLAGIAVDSQTTVE